MEGCLRLSCFFTARNKAQKEYDPFKANTEKEDKAQFMAIVKKVSTVW